MHPFRNTVSTPNRWGFGVGSLRVFGPRGPPPLRLSRRWRGGGRHVERPLVAGVCVHDLWRKAPGNCTIALAFVQGSTGGVSRGRTAVSNNYMYTSIFFRSVRKRSFHVDHKMFLLPGYIVFFVCFTAARKLCTIICCNCFFFCFS